MRAGYQTVPSSRSHASRGRATRLRNSRGRPSSVVSEHSTQSQETLSSPRVSSSSSSKIPRSSMGQTSPIVESRVKLSGASSPKRPSNEIAANITLAPITPESSPECTPSSPLKQHQENETTPEPLSPSTSDGEDINPIVTPEDSSDEVPALTNGIPEEVPLPSKTTTLSWEDEERLRTVSCTSTVFFDAPGSAAPHQGSVMSIDETTMGAINMPSVDSVIGRFLPEKEQLPQIRPELERTGSSNYSSSGALPSPVSPTSPTAPRSPIVAPEAMREEIPTEIETMRRRLFSYSSDIFKSSTWEPNSDLDLTNLGCGNSADAGAENTGVRISSEQSTVVEGHLPSRMASFNSAQVLSPSRRTTADSVRKDAPVQWNDGSGDASTAASEAQPAGVGQRSVTETCTITSTQAIKSRTFSSANESESSSGTRRSRELLRGSGEGSASAELPPSTANDVEKGLGDTQISSGSAIEPAAGGNGDTEIGMSATQTTTSGGSITSGMTGWVKSVWERYSPVAVTRSIARLLGYGKETNETGGGGEVGTTWRARRVRSRGSWRGRGSRRSARKKRFWRVRMPWQWKQRDEAPLLAGGSTDA